MDWNRGMEATYYCSIVDKDTWRDIDRFEITGGQISRTTGELLESANISCKDYDYSERWIRVWMNARQNGDTEHIAMFTGIATSPEAQMHGIVKTSNLECYSVLKPLQDVLLPRGWYAPMGSGKAVVQELLSVTPAPSKIDEHIPTLNQNIVAEDGETNLSMLNKIMKAINWRIVISGDGTINIKPLDTTPVIEFSRDYDAVETDLRMKDDWYDCPNVFRAISGDESEVVIDDTSSLSVKARGREIWAEETSAQLNSGETLYEYALRRLKERQSTAVSVSYNRRYHPDIYVTDCVSLNYPQVQGTFVVKSQTIEIGGGSTTTEEVMK